MPKAESSSTEDAEDCSKGASLTSGDLARACETTVRTVRFYEEAGLLKPGTRSCGGHRLYGDAERAKLQLITDLRESGMCLNDIKALFQLKRKAGNANEASAEMSRILEGRIAEMQRKIAKLRRLREELAAMVSVLDECHTCDAQEFPKTCQSCDVMERGDLPRAMRLLWENPPAS